MVSTQKGNKVYLHLLESGRSSYFIPGFQATIHKMTLFDSGNNVEHNLSEYGLLFRVPQAEQDPVDTIVVLELDP
jgi:alpha-L-fucosidase